MQTAPVCYVASPQGGAQILLQIQPNQIHQSTQPRNLYLRTHHKPLGILQMTVGIICFSMETVGACIGGFGVFSGITYTGFYTGAIFFAAGLMGYLAYRKNNHCFVISCMVMSIIAALTVVSGIMTSVMEMKTMVPLYRSKTNRQLQTVKESIIIGCCAFELFLSIIHASFTCATCCSCCWPDTRRAASNLGTPRTLVIQPPLTGVDFHAVSSGATAIPYTPGGSATVLSVKPTNQMTTEWNALADDEAPPPYCQ